MAEWKRDMPWRQGSVIALEDLNALGVGVPDDCQGALVVSHDCDLANDDKKDPILECVPFELLEAPDGNHTNAKNPRTLHLEIQLDEVTRWVQLRAPHRFLLNKTDLVVYEPVSSVLGDKERQVLQGWLAARYRRHAFPDELVERMRPVSARLDKQLRSRAKAVLGVWIDYQPRGAVGEEEPYELWLYIVYSTESAAYASQAEEVVSDLQDRFSDSLPGLVLTACGAVSEHGFTLADQRSTVEFKLEHLSHRIHPDGVLVD